RRVRADESDRLELLDGEEVVRPEMIIAIGRVGVDARRLNREDDGRLLGARRIELDGAGEVGEAAADLRDQVADLERDLGVSLVDRERADVAGGGGDSHLIP